jgi:uncharacterized membrane protein SpoIIM required for sporulation
MSKNGNYFRKEFVLAFVIVFVLSCVFEVWGMNDGYRVSTEEANKTISWISEMRQSVSWMDIFANNIEIAYISAVPLFGLLFYFFVSYNTGTIYGNVGRYYNLSIGQTYSLNFTNPIGILEDVAMTLLVAESLLIVYLLVKDREEIVERLKTHSWKTLIITTLLLLFGALIEAWLIRIS